MPEIKPNMTLREVVQYCYELRHPNHGLAQADLDEEVQQCLEDRHYMLSKAGAIGRVFANDAEAEQWDAEEPQRVFDKAMDYYSLVYSYDTGLDIETAYPRILAAAIDECDEKDLPVKQYMRDLLAELEAPPVLALTRAEQPQRAKLCFARQHLTGIEFKIWDLARAYWESSGECWLSSRNVAKQCDVSRDTAKKYMRQLIATGWLEVLEEAKPGTTGTAKEQSRATGQ